MLLVASFGSRRRRMGSAAARFALLRALTRRAPSVSYFLRQLHRVSFVTGEGRSRIQARRTGSFSSHSEMGGGVTSSRAIAIPSPSSDIMLSRLAKTRRAA